MSATLADDSVLVTHFDPNPAGITDPSVPESAADLGDQLVLCPSATPSDSPRPAR